MYLKDKQFSVYLVAVIHFALVCIGISALVEEQRVLYTEYSLKVIICYYGAHILLISVLVISIYKDKPLLTVVWLVPTCLVFMWITIKSILAIETMEKGFLYYGVNLITVGAYWFGWFRVFNHFNLKMRNLKEQDSLTLPLTLKMQK